ncbi:MAG: valine--tRNA ligase [Candidatus Aenigmarchaeota archaeon]|nr:valine--tRNA ligase [Candidatus Aenigmarchaeota archaeon]
MQTRYNPKDTEPKIQKFWQENNLFKFERVTNKPSFCIDSPPPFTSGIPHMGHVLWWTWIDVIARYKRMRGFNVLLPIGWDCHGLPTELRVEEKYKIKKTFKERFLKLCKEWTIENIGKMKSKMIEMGVSADWDYEYSTDSEEYLAFVQKTLLNLHFKKLLKRVEHPVMWCTKCETTLAKAEVGYKEKEGVLYDIKIPVENDFIIISTTRPEFLPACVGIFVHPDDKRYKKFVDKKAKLPIYDREVSILTNKEVDMEFGTGAVYLCTYGDESDIKWQKKYNLPSINIITEDGKLNENAGKFEGLILEDARNKIIEELGMMGLIEKEKKFKHNVLCHTERGGCLTPIEFLIKKQWAIEAVKFSDDVLELSKNMEWYPEYMEKRLINWVDSMDWDWIISRQRVFGTPIPFWYCENCGKIFYPEEQDLPVNPAIEKYFSRDNCECGGKLIGETDICDGWVDSSISPLIISGYWKNDEELFKKLYPNDLRQQGHDIIRTWAYYTILRCFLEIKEKPWKKILINGMIRGPDGREMHRSLGNLVMPDEVLSKHGADTIRAGMIMMGAYGNDVPFSWKDMDFTFRFLTKYWNIFRFSIPHFEKIERTGITLIDSWIITKLQRLIKNVTEDLDNFQFTSAFEALHNFVWHVLADNYLEMIKYRLYEDKLKESALFTLYNVLVSMNKMLAPIMPHITEEIWQIFFRKFENETSVHISSWPKFSEKLIYEENEKTGDIAVAITAFVRQYKNKRGISLNSPIEKLIIECDMKTQKRLEDVFEDIKGTVKVKDIEFGKGEHVLENYDIKLSVRL